MVGLVATGCGGFTRPTTQQECFDQASSSGSGGDADSIWQLTYDDAAQQVGEATLVYVCLGPDTTATVTAQAPEGVQVSPDPLEVAGGAAAPAHFELLVTGQEGGGLEVTLDTGEGGGTIGLDVVVDGDEWSLEGP